MVKETIQIFARLKPIANGQQRGQYEIADESQLLTFNLPKDTSKGIINNKKELHKFRFEQVFDEESKQREVFSAVALPVIDKVLQGYNGTVFAYGQTGSGKTFTITGGEKSHSDRGIIPLTLEHIFGYYEQNQESEFTTQISYLEIYNETGYDLLDPKHDVSGIDDLPKVTLMEDVDQNIHLKNLSIHNVRNVEDAFNLLFTGDVNRTIAATPMNQASTRSHCIFTVHITTRLVGSATVRRSKLHLVDLAGSERVSKTGVNGVLLTEAKYINLSLHYLEQVIVALSESNRHHIPYRNSMMTSVLRDSLGGNCMTTMIATCSVDRSNIDETISTCRFSQRVAMIKNDAVLNEELDPKLLIDKLKKEICQLKEEILLLSGQERTEALTEDEKQTCELAVKKYISDKDFDGSIISVPTDMRQINFCFLLMKRQIVEKESLSARKTSPVKNDDDTTTTTITSSSYESKEMQRLCSLLQQRDNEIRILVNLLKKEKMNKKTLKSDDEHQSMMIRKDSTSSSSSSSLSFMSYDVNAAADADRTSSSDKQRNGHKLDRKLFGDMSVGRKEAFELFKRDHELFEEMERTKRVLKQHYSKARLLAQQLKQSRDILEKLKMELDSNQTLQSLQNSGRKTVDTLVDVQLLVEEKKRYREFINELRLVKTESEHLEHQLKKYQVRIVQSFDTWWSQQAADLHEKSYDIPTEKHSTSNVLLPQTERSRETSVISTGDPETDAAVKAFYEARQKYSQKVLRQDYK